MFDYAPVSDQPDWKDLPLEQSKFLRCLRHTITFHGMLCIPMDAYISKYIGFLMDSYGFLELAFLRKLMLGGKNIVLTMSGLGRTCGVGWWRFQQDASREALMDFSCLS